uniref:Uncharacterized protein n=1 Tax=Coccolithus braarudii TaxID=221442 RepID=A0A7S0L2Q0_9EUKA
MLPILPVVVHAWLAAPQLGTYAAPRGCVRSRATPKMCAELPASAVEPRGPQPVPPTSYDEAEARGFELYQTGEFERAIRMFELAQTLPGAGSDYVRQKQSGMIGSATAPPNPRGLKLERFATAEQKLIAQYNIACCYSGMGDGRRALELLETYLQQVRNPLDQLNEMIVDADFASIRTELLQLRGQLKEQEKPPGLFGLPFGNPMRDLAAQVGVEWKD